MQQLFNLISKRIESHKMQLRSKLVRKSKMSLLIIPISNEQNQNGFEADRRV